MASMSESAKTLSQLADDLLALHQPGNPVVVPTCWDAWSASLAEEAGFAAITVGSHPMADSIGRADGEGMGIDEVVARVRQITEAVAIPVSVDLEAGYGLSPAGLIDQLLTAGAVGLNIEDTVHSDGGRLRTAEEHAQYVAGLREAAGRADVHVVINARTDWFKGKHGDEATRVEDAIARMKLCAEAGADALYPVAFHAEETLTRLCAELPLPVNAIAKPAEGDLEMLRRAGAGRISFGPTWQMALGEVSKEWLARWR